MQRAGMPLLVHGEVTDPAVDVFDRERVFIDQVLAAAAPALPGTEGGARAHHDARGGAVRGRRRRRTSRRRSPRTTCSTTATRSSTAACGRTTTACRCSSARRIAARCWPRRDLGQPEVLPRHRQRAARARREGGGVRRRRLLHRARRARAVRRRRSSSAGALDRLEGFAVVSRPRLLRPAAQPRHGHARARDVDGARVRPLRRRAPGAALVPMEAGVEQHWKLA